MASFDDWLTVSDPRLFGEALAEQFRLSQKELQKATEALAPAFALGFRNALAEPEGWQDLSKAFAALVPGLQGPAKSAGHPGEIFMQSFFGSEALVSAIARQASLVAGIAPDTLQKLMPGLAALTMQGMVRQSMEALTRHAQAGLATGDLGGATAEMMRRGANAMEALSRPSDAPPARRAGAGISPMAPAFETMADVFAQSLQASLSWMQPPAEKAGAAAPPPPRVDPMAPFAALFKAFADGMTGAAAPPAPPQPDPAPKAGAGDLVGGMMRTGQSLGDGYAREMAALFERYGRTSKTG